MAVSVAANIAGVRVVGISSLWFFVLLWAPFALIVLLAPLKIGALAHVAVTTTPTSTVGLVGGILIAMWNYMGWDNASTIAVEVKRPQRTYPRAMLLSCDHGFFQLHSSGSGMWLTGVSPSAFETGSWADLAGLVAGPWLRVALVLGGLISAFGMLNALVMSYSRLPLAMAQDGMLPHVFAKVHPVPAPPGWPSSFAVPDGRFASGWASNGLSPSTCLLTGASLVLEFAALVALRIKEPALERPFRVPGGTAAAVLLGVCPRSFSVSPCSTAKASASSG